MPDISRRTLLAGAAATAGSSLLSPLAAATSAKRNSFRFVHFTDLHIQPEKGAFQGVSKAIKKVLSLSPRPDFVITGGDHVMDISNCSLDRANVQFNLLHEALKPLEMPLHYVVGNHDCYRWTNSIGTDMDPAYGKKMFEERIALARTYRSFNHKGWHFVLLDNIQPTDHHNWISHVGQTQLDWLKADLAAVPEHMPIVTAIHVPIFTIYNQYANGTTVRPSGRMICTNGKRVSEILRHHKVKAVLQGHTHVVEDIDYLGTHYISGGAVCGDWWKGPRFGVHPEGFMVYDVHDSNLSWEYVPYGWKVVA